MQVQEQIGKLSGINSRVPTESPLAGDFVASTGGEINIGHNVGEKNVSLNMPLRYYGVETLTELIDLLHETREYLKGLSVPEE